jgi:hypothetical protein
MSETRQKRTLAPQQIIGGLRQKLTDFRQESARAVGLRHIVITARRLRDLILSVERVGGDRDDRYRSQRGIGFDPARGCVTVYD